MLKKALFLCILGTLLFSGCLKTNENLGEGSSVLASDTSNIVVPENFTYVKTRKPSNDPAIYIFRKNGREDINCEDCGCFVGGSPFRSKNQLSISNSKISCACSEETNPTEFAVCLP